MKQSRQRLKRVKLSAQERQRRYDAEQAREFLLSLLQAAKKKGT